MSQSIQPLRIQKGTTLSSPTKTNGLPAQRPLSELGPMERRRNSPSYNQVSKAVFDGESSPFDSSPSVSNSPRLYWQNRDPASGNRQGVENRNPFEQRETSPSPAKRSSIENLKRASRVKNSSMFAREHNQEYDPTSSPIIERPLATGRPLSVQVHTKQFVGNTLNGLRNDASPHKPKFEIYDPSRSPGRETVVPEPQKSPNRGQTSPAKSSLSKNSRYAQAQAFDSENGMWSEDEDSIAERQLPPGKSLHGHSKSVTFDAAPPQINEYEMTTPDPSSVASGSREGSYESIDAEEDESFDRGSSIDRDDSFDASLEDTDKTPVVLPEDWRFMSPEVASRDLVAHMEDPFIGPKSSPAPTAEPKTISDTRPSPTRTDSVNSNGERRPLPPLPPLGMPVFPRPRSDSNNSLSATAERVSSFQRMLPSPPLPASITKSEIQGMGGCSVPIEDRLRLMMIQDQDKPKPPAEEQRDRRLRRGDTTGKSPEAEDHTDESKINLHQDECENDDVADLGEYQLPPRISRESILRKVKSQQLKDTEHEYSSPVPGASPERESLDDIDPDTPLPSLEDQSALDDGEDAVVIKQEDDGEVDLYSIPDFYHQSLPVESQFLPSMGYGAFSQQSSNASVHEDDDGESHYSNDSPGEIHQGPQSKSVIEDEGPPTPRAHSPTHLGQALENKTSHRMSLPQFASMLGDDDFGLSLQSYLTPSPPVMDEPSKTELPVKIGHAVQSIERPMTPVEQLDPPRFPGYDMDGEEEPRTPDSVIRHSLAEPSPPDSPGVPEPIATIKAPGAKLKTRPSITPADVQMMAETRRQVSAQLPIVPPAADLEQNYPSSISDVESFQESAGDASSKGDPVKQIKRKSSLVQLEVPVEELEEGLSFGMDRAFDRVIEAQKVASALSYIPLELVSPFSFCPSFIIEEEFSYRLDNDANAVRRPQKGYLMRQNTKMVVASSASNDSAPDHGIAQGPSGRGTRSAGNSPRKPSQQTWTTEPWNGKVRRKSIRQSAGSPQKKVSSGPAPPLPGQSSNVTSGLDSVTEDQALPKSEEPEDGSERGRLFVKVVGVKELDLPLPKGERSYFALTLDNGLHCVTTAWLELGKYAPIGQEFELVVLNDLEFQLTLQTKLEEPKPARKVVESPTKAVKIQKPSTFSRVFASPRKRKELEMKQQEEAERVAKQKQADTQANKRNAQPTAWDLLNKLVAKDGSFARSYVCLKDHESQAYGKPYTVDVPCFNEWATEEIRTLNSLKSNRGIAGATQRKAPYKIGKLELQLLFVPKPKDAKEEDMPKSMNACIRELQEAELSTEKSWEGHLSQQGGDCPYWRRRFFRLEGSKLTAYHEATRQPRATINLAKASKLIDDKCALTQKEVSGRGGSRRKSAFAEEEEGYMFVEEGFRVRFANGETIDFYADSAAEKDGWMKVLADVVGKDVKQTKNWTDLVLAREKSTATRAARSAQGQIKAPPSAMRSAPPTPGPRQSSQQAKSVVRAAAAPPPVEKDARHLAQSPEKKEVRPTSSPEKKDARHARSSEKNEGRVIGQATRQKTRSMIF